MTSTGDTRYLFELHGVPISFVSDDERIRQRLVRQWLPFAAGSDQTPALSPIQVTLRAVVTSPSPPSYAVVSKDPSLVYYRENDKLVAYFGRWGRYDVDLQAGAVEGRMTEACLQSYGVFEDMIIVALAPLLRRRGLYTIHAFAASMNGRAIVLIGDIAAGKTTTGISLLCGGAQLLANDSPLLRMQSESGIELCAYPGLISTYPDSLAWFSELAPILSRAERFDGSAKLSFAAEEVWPSPWQMSATPAILLYPHVVSKLEQSQLVPMSRFQALQRLVGQSIESWDSATIPANLKALQRLTTVAPAFSLKLAPDVDKIPDIIMNALPEGS